MTASRGPEWLAAARRSFEAGRLVTARAMVDAVRAVGADADPLDELDARLLLQEGRYQAALEITRRAVARNPQNWHMRCLSADAFMAVLDPAAAAAEAAEAVVAAPHEAAPKAVLGTALLALGETDDARACLAEAAAGNPGHAGYRLSLAQALTLRGQTAAARATLREAIASHPREGALRVAAMRLAIGVRDFADALALADNAADDGMLDALILGLRGHTLSCLGRDEDAVEAYQQALYLAPEDPYVRHLVAAAGLVTPPPRASADYVRVLFDGFAPHFEMDLVQLDYRIPGLVRSAVLAHGPFATPGATGLPYGPVLDLGCGTGLVALVLSDLAVGPFTGIDLSPAMLAEARAKHLYDHLIEGDICRDLAPLGLFHLAVAADVLPYLGDPAPFFAAVVPHLAAGGLLILTTETLDDDGTAPFRLGRRARYGHRPEALCDTARQAGFAVRECRPEPIRRDQDQPVTGCLVVLELVTK